MSAHRPASRSAARPRAALRSNPRTRTGNLEYFYIYSGDFDRAEEAAEAWFRERPGNAYALGTRILPPLLRGDVALAEQRLAAALNQLPNEPSVISLQGLLHARRNQTDLALKCVRQALDSPRSFGHTHHAYYNIACVHAVLGETDKAMAWLEHSVDTGFFLSGGSTSRKPARRPRIRTPGRRPSAHVHGAEDNVL